MATKLVKGGTPRQLLEGQNKMVEIRVNSWKGRTRRPFGQSILFLKVFPCKSCGASNLQWQLWNRQTRLFPIFEFHRPGLGLRDCREFARRVVKVRFGQAFARNNSIFIQIWICTRFLSLFEVFNHEGCFRNTFTIFFQTDFCPSMQGLATLLLSPNHCCNILSFSVCQKLSERCFLVFTLLVFLSFHMVKQLKKRFVKTKKKH